MTHKSMCFNDGVTVTVVVRNDYSIHFWGMTKCEVVSRIKNAYLIEKSGELWFCKKYLL